MSTRADRIYELAYGDWLRTWAPALDDVTLLAVGSMAAREATRTQPAAGTSDDHAKTAALWRACRDACRAEYRRRQQGAQATLPGVPADHSRWTH